MSETMNRETEMAICGAQSASDAVAELLRFAREGAIGPDFAFGDNTILDLSMALLAALHIERPRLKNPDRVHGEDSEGAELLDGLETALATFMEGWA